MKNCVFDVNANTYTSSNRPQKNFIIICQINVQRSHSRMLITQVTVFMALISCLIQRIICDDEIASEVCRSPDDPILGLEGFIPHGFHIHQAYIFLNSAETTFLPNCVSNVTQKGCTSDDITSFGVRQQINLGKYFAGIYLKHFNNNETSFITWSSPQCIQSNVALTQGLHSTNDVSNDVTRTLFKDSDSCLELKKEVNDGIYNLSQYAMKTSTTKKPSPDEISSIVSSIPFLLCNTTRNQLFKQLNINLTNIIEIYKKSNSDTNIRDIIRKCRPCSVCISKVLVHLIKQMQNKKRKNMIVYHLDDTVFTSLLFTITNGRLRIPLPSSRLVLEVYSTKITSSTGMHLKVLFNGQDITSDVPLCNRNVANAACKLKYFTDFHKLKAKSIGR